MSSKINVLPIVFNHFRTLRNARRNKLSTWDFVIQLGLPLVAALVSFKFEFDLAGSYANAIAALAIVFGFAFAVTVFVFQLRMQMAAMQVSSKEAAIAEISPQIDTAAPKLIDELFSNCLYAVLLSGFATLLASSIEPFGLKKLGASLLVGIVVHLLLVLLMCFKRINSAYRKVSDISA